MTGRARASGAGERGESGFTLFEALVALALTGFIMSCLGVVAGQWLPRWRAGFDDLQRTELVALALDRLAGDVAAAEFVTPLGEPRVLFFGSESSVTLARTPLGPKLPGAARAAPAGLEVVRWSADDKGLTRARVNLTPQTGRAAGSQDLEFADSLLLLRPPLRVAFAYAGQDRIFSDQWADPARLPSAVRVSVRDGDGELTSASTVVRLRTDAPACAVAQTQAACLTQASEEPKKTGEEPRDDGGRQ